MAIRATILSIALAVVYRGALAQSAAQGVPAISISGAVEHPRTLTIGDLRREPATTEAVFLHTGHGAIDATFTGVLLWTLPKEAGVKLDPAKKNDAVRHTVVITGSDGYSALLSYGEIDPEFGGDQAIVAYERDGKPLDDSGGLARLVIPADKAAGRSVAGIVGIEVR